MGTLYNKYSYWDALPIRPPTEMEFQYIGIGITQVRNDSETYVSLSDIKFLDANNNVFPLLGVFGSISSSLRTVSDEDEVNLIDNDVNTKMTAYTWSSSHFESIDIKLMDGCYLDISVFNTFQWYTEDYSSTRDPISWVIYVSQDNNNWYKINSETNYDVTTARKALAYSGSLTYPKYKYLKFHISKIRTNTSRSVQLSDLWLVTDGGESYTPYPTGTTITCSTSTSSGYPATNLIDNDPTTVSRCSWSSSSGRDYIITFPDGDELVCGLHTIFGWNTASTNTGYDPVSWTLYGANQSDFSDAVILNQESDYNVTTNRNAEAYWTSLGY